MDLLAFGDPHIKPTGTAVDYDRLVVPDGVEAVVTAGDVIDRVDADSLAAGRRFLERLDATGLPTFSVPGNHDPVDQYAELLDGLDTVALLHESFEQFQSAEGEWLTVVGWGCEGTTFEPEVQTTAFPSLDPRRADADRRYAADRAAQQVEDSAYAALVEQDPARPRDRFRDVASELGIERSSYPVFKRQWTRLCDSYERLTRLFDAAPDPFLVVTHVPPYNTELDIHHSKGNRDVDLDGVHCGSLGLKLAVREHRPLAALSGHSHRRAYEPTPTHMLSLDYQGITRLELDPETGAFSYEYLHR